MFVPASAAQRTRPKQWVIRLLIAVPFASMLQVVFEEVIVPRRLAQFDTNAGGSEERAGADEVLSSSAWETTGRRPSVIHFTRG
jgi:hypothetical protein